MKVACWERSAEATVSLAKRADRARPYMVKVILPELQSVGLTVIHCGKDSDTAVGPISPKVFKLAIKNVEPDYPQRGNIRRKENLSTDIPLGQGTMGLPKGGNTYGNGVFVVLKRLG